MPRLTGAASGSGAQRACARRRSQASPARVRRTSNRAGPSSYQIRSPARRASLAASASGPGAAPQRAESAMRLCGAPWVTRTLTTSPGRGAPAAKSSAAPITLADVRTLQEATRRVFVHETLKAYIVDIVNTTRGAGPNPLPGWNNHVRVGASPRGGIALMQISQAIALMSGRNHVMPDDIKAMRYGILRHRIIRTFDALADNVSIEGLIDAVFNAVPVP